MTVDVQDLADKLAIQETLARYCRGIDRCDLETLKSAFWPDAVSVYGDTPLNAQAWAEGVLARLAEMLRTQHAISNIIIDLKGEPGAHRLALSETYCRAYHEVEAHGVREEMMVGGRYLDRFEKRGGEWRIIHRTYVMDFNQNGPSTSKWDGPMYGRLTLTGARYPHDWLYTNH